MKRFASIAALTAVMVAAVAYAARPGTEQQLVQQLNGQPVRLVMPDGGPWGIFTTYDAGTANNFACAPLTGMKNNIGATVVPNIIVVSPQQGINLCMMPSINGPRWDGGCNTVQRDINYGLPLAQVPQYLTPDTAATTVCAITDAGFLSLPIWWAQ